MAGLNFLEGEQLSECKIDNDLRKAFNKSYADMKQQREGSKPVPPDVTGRQSDYLKCQGCGDSVNREFMQVLPWHTQGKSKSYYCLSCFEEKKKRRYK